MGKSLNELEANGFRVKKKPVVTTKPVKSQKAKPCVEKVVEKIVYQPVMDNTKMLSEVHDTNRVMHQAIAKITESLKDISKKPKKLKCQNIERDTRGLMKSFEVIVIDQQ